ncbi:MULTISPECIES: GNAT family N-acetyltransferase [unclassified Exiguobacterium]|uniref:GNAT family N-acetyltransferase n=1 Tax=unclassified Exiguobacterium TaxID=2644629 RepID=UPI00103C3442|nr:MULTISPECIES: GNAT family N-acetyltransferase [unclassified Exiguobacterium]TCI42952.1 GNAT family N-acetyltransferase [Exiguobacterium sp. SH5S32]TCI49712.1 GNAT family N-acetyltransferase [Exiguobacterium sp. SH1S4]TCI67775.1 GNAT family N-acetyltransferase [Exiguobacterium sp. SH1S1]
MKIRIAKPSDAYHIAKVQIDSWQSTYKGILSEDYLKDLNYKTKELKWYNILQNQTVYVVENLDEEIVGFAHGGPSEKAVCPTFTGELYSIYLLQHYQYQGLGKLLFDAVALELVNEGFSSLKVFVLDQNPSRLFYEALGGKEIEVTSVEIHGIDYREIVYGWENIGTKL